MISEDPIFIRKRKMRNIEDEMNSPETAPWKRELLDKKIHQLKEEIAQLEKEMEEKSEMNHEVFNTKAFKEEGH